MSAAIRLGSARKPALEANILPPVDDNMPTSFLGRTSWGGRYAPSPAPSARDLKASTAANIVPSGKDWRPTGPISSCSGTTKLQPPPPRGAYRPAWEEIPGGA